MPEHEDPSPLPTDADTPSPAGEPQVSPGAATRMVDETATPEVRAYAMWIHMGTLIATVVLTAGAGFPFFVPAATALIMWLAKRSDHSFIDDHGREAANFQISLLIFYTIFFIVSVATACLALPITAVLTFLLSIVNIVGLILAGIAANKGQIYRYPVCIRVIGPPSPSGTGAS